MKRCIIGLAAVIALNACADNSTLSPNRLGAITFGSSLADVETALKESAAAEKNYGDESCRYVSFATFPGTLIMVENGIVTRADAAANVANSLGVSVGTSMTQVLQVHPQAQVTPHKYDPDGFYLTFPTPDGKAAIVMEVAEGKVTDIRAGLRPSVEYVEGCL